MTKQISNGNLGIQMRTAYVGTQVNILLYIQTQVCMKN